MPGACPITYLFRCAPLHLAAVVLACTAEVAIVFVGAWVLGSALWSQFAALWVREAGMSSVHAAACLLCASG